MKHIWMGWMTRSGGDAAVGRHGGHRWRAAAATRAAPVASMPWSARTSAREGRCARELMMKKLWLMLRFRVLFDQQLNQRLKQGFASFPNIMDKLEETEIEREFLL